jgi:RsiW-degrading membrane proteinase PrsW (M82 family)
LVLVGSFLVPVVYVVFFFDRRGASGVDTAATLTSFVYGGLLGVIAASVLEPVFVAGLNILTVFIVAAIEEVGKVLGVLVVARRRRHSMEVSGVVLGAAAGMGFAALESMGYAFVAFMESQGSLSATVGVTLLRALLSPLGHGTWTALLAATLFRASEEDSFRLTLRVVGGLALVILLHALWNGLPPLLGAFLPSGLAMLIGQGAVGGAGLGILAWRWRRARE